MSRDKMQAAFDEAMAHSMLEETDVPMWLLRVAFEIGYKAGESAALQPGDDA
jgi:hypothetical protein